jgi:hypothetical protein
VRRSALRRRIRDCTVCSSAGIGDTSWPIGGVSKLSPRRGTIPKRDDIRGALSLQGLSGRTVSLG